MCLCVALLGRGMWCGVRQTNTISVHKEFIGLADIFYTDYWCSVWVPVTACACACMHACMYAHVYTCVCALTHVRAHTHTHTYTHTHSHALIFVCILDSVIISVWSSSPVNKMTDLVPLGSAAHKPQAKKPSCKISFVSELSRCITFVNLKYFFLNAFIWNCYLSHGISLLTKRERGSYFVSTCF